MNVDNLSPPARALLIEALPGGEVVNVLYRDGKRVEQGFTRERRCFALAEHGWLKFLGWDGALAASAHCRARWALTSDAFQLLSDLPGPA